MAYGQQQLHSWQRRTPCTRSTRRRSASCAPSHLLCPHTDCTSARTEALHLPWQAQRYAQAVLQIEDEDRVWRRLESSRRAASITASRGGGAAQAEKAAANEQSLWDRRLPAHLRLGAEFGLRREEQSSLQKLQRQAEAAAAAAAASATRTWVACARARASPPCSPRCGIGDPRNSSLSCAPLATEVRLSISLPWLRCATCCGPRSTFGALARRGSLGPVACGPGHVRRMPFNRFYLCNPAVSSHSLSLIFSIYFGLPFAAELCGRRAGRRGPRGGESS